MYILPPPLLSKNEKNVTLAVVALHLRKGATAGLIGLIDKLFTPHIL